MRILMISDMRRMDKASSTQIMVYNLVYGLQKEYGQVTFVCVVGEEKENDSLLDTFKPITEKIVMVPTAANFMANASRPLYGIFAGLSCFLRNGWYKKKLKNAVGESDEYDIILSHSPSVEPTFYGRAAKTIFPKARYVQFWSDPYARSNLPMNVALPLKRWPMSKIEKEVLKFPEAVVYGTDTLYEAQRMQFPSLKNKMSACDVSYNVYNSMAQEAVVFPNQGKICGYVGNYYKEIRNIQACYDAFTDNPSLGNLVLCGAGNIELAQKENIVVKSRCSPAEATAIENALDILICVLNKNTAQIPGKIFYQANSGKPIIVILDGPDRKQIHEYLKKFNRFEFCENNEQSISECISRVKSGLYTASLETPLMLSPEAFGNSVIGK